MTTNDEHQQQKQHHSKSNTTSSSADNNNNKLMNKSSSSSWWQRFFSASHSRSDVAQEQLAKHYSSSSKPSPPVKGRTKTLSNIDDEDEEEDPTVLAQKYVFSGDSFYAAILILFAVIGFLLYAALGAQFDITDPKKHDPRELRKTIKAKGVGNALLADRIMKVGSERERVAYEMEYIQSRVKAEECIVYTAASQIPSEHYHLFGLYSAFDLNAGELLNISMDLSLSNVVVGIMPHPILSNVAVRLISDDDCSNLQLVTTQPIKMGQELFISYDEPCVNKYQSGTPMMSHYELAESITKDILSLGGGVGEQKGSRSNKSKSVSSSYINFVKDTITRYDDITSTLIPSDYRDIKFMKQQEIPISEYLIERVEIAWIENNGSCVDLIGRNGNDSLISDPPSYFARRNINEKDVIGMLPVSLNSEYNNNHRCVATVENEVWCPDGPYSLGSAVDNNNIDNSCDESINAEAKILIRNTSNPSILDLKDELTMMQVIAIKSIKQGEKVIFDRRATLGLF